MSAHRDVQDFFELRAGLVGMRDYAIASLAFMDKTGLALQVRKGTHPKHAVGKLDALRETVKRHYKARKPAANGNGQSPREGVDVPLPDGSNVSMREAAKILKCSDANVRLMSGDGRLPKPTYERRGSKKRPDVKLKVQVIPKDAVLAYRDAAKAAAAGA